MVKFTDFIHTLRVIGEAMDEDVMTPEKYLKLQQSRECNVKPDEVSALLKLSGPNDKINHYSISLAAGYSCPSAKQCMAVFDRKKRKIVDGKDSEFRCYMASMESQYPNLAKLTFHNYDIVKKLVPNVGELADLIDFSISRTPANTSNIFRIHVGGDFFHQSYMDAWIEVAHRRKNTLFYGYTKEIEKWLKARDSIPGNMVLTASYGGRHDSLIEEHGLKYSKVVYSMEEAEQLGLNIDIDDSLAWSNREPFALLIHGTQPAGSKSAEALKSIRKHGKNKDIKKVSMEVNRIIDAKRVSAERII